MLELSERTSRAKRGPGRERFQDETRFIRSWLENPLRTGAVAPSGRFLAHTMASYIDPRRPGCVVELGPGTGAVTEALIQRGLEQQRLVLLEYNLDFCQLLRRRFPRATIVHGDAYDAREALADVVTEPCAGFVSGLPLFTKPLDQRLSLLAAAQDLMHPDAPFVQFTYSVVPPIPARSRHYTATASERIWRNIPPARVWVYRRP